MIYIRKSVGPRTEAWGTPALRYSAAFNFWKTQNMFKLYWLDSWFMVHNSNLKFQEQLFFTKLKNHESWLFLELKIIQKFLRQHQILHEKWINNKPVYDLLSSFWENQVSLVPQDGPVLDLLEGGDSQLPQTPAAFNTPFFLTNHY